MTGAIALGMPASNDCAGKRCHDDINAPSRPHHRDECLAQRSGINL